jgi:hypothetical protein
MWIYNPNNISLRLRDKLKNYNWNSKQLLDLHSLGIHWFDSGYMPLTLDVETMSSYIQAGLTPPNCLPKKFPDNIHEIAKDWYAENYYSLKHGGVYLLDSGHHMSREDEWEKADIRILMVKLTEYEVSVSGTGPQVCAGWMKSWLPNVFVDYAYIPPRCDVKKFIENDMPVLMGCVTKRPPAHFDLIGFSHCVSVERLVAAFAWTWSGIPMFRYERFTEGVYANHTERRVKHFPFLFMGGIAAYGCESVYGDSHRGPGSMGLVDFSIIGSGEMADTQLVEMYLDYFQRRKMDYGLKEEFLMGIDNDSILGFYNPALVLYEYKDKIHQLVDYQGREIGEAEVFQGGGAIDKISLLDLENKKKYVLAGEGSLDWEELLKFQGAFLDMYRTAEEDLESLGESFLLGVNWTAQGKTSL